MKKIFLATLMTISSSGFAQSFIIMDNGITLTTDIAGFVYDLGDYAYPQKVNMKGGNFFVEDNSILATVAENGALFRKYEVIPEKIIGKGINYFLSAEGELYTVNAQGIVNIIPNEAFKSATRFGGNYFMISTPEGDLELFTVSKTGEVIKAELEEGFNPKDIIALGGNYFMSNRGVLYTVSAEGKIQGMPHMRIGILQKKGGNFFTDSSGLFYTVADDGSLIMPGLPLALKLNMMTKLGSNYFLDLAGRLYTVDNQGQVYERIMQDHDFRNARIISL